LDEPPVRPDGQQVRLGEPPVRPDGQRVRLDEPPVRPDGQRVRLGEPPVRPDGLRVRLDEPLVRPDGQRLVAVAPVRVAWLALAPGYRSTPSTSRKQATQVNPETNAGARSNACFHHLSEAALPFHPDPITTFTPRPLPDRNATARITRYDQVKTFITLNARSNLP
jgi:hypothetical protein